MKLANFKLSKVCLSSQGFTLVELLVVVSLISIISGVGFASLATYSKQQLVTQSAEDVKQAINLARFNAISSVKPQTSSSSQQCTSSDVLDAYQFNICGPNFSTCISTDPAVKYEVVAICGVKKIVVVAKRLPTGVDFSASNINLTNLCKSMIFESRSGVSTGVPCAVYLSGSAANNVGIFLDENGNATVQ